MPNKSFSSLNARLSLSSEKLDEEEEDDDEEDYLFFFFFGLFLDLSA